MADDDPLTEADDAPLTAEEILRFGPCVEAQVWTPMWLEEARAPIAVVAGRPKFGRVFNDEGIGKAVIIRPCMSRGARLRGLPPIYTPQMLEKHAGVFDGWPMFLDHAPRELAATLAKHGRSVKELGGQVVRGRWDRSFVQEADQEFGYQKGGVLAEVWATPLVRKTVGENPNLLHTSINAWPTSGKPGPVPWRPSVKGMVVEGIRRQPQGSVDYVVRGGAGGRLLLEGVEGEPAWPEAGEWSAEDTRLVVSLAESFYASPQMTEIALPSKPAELAAWLQEHAPHLLPAVTAVRELDSEDAPLISALVKKGHTRAQAAKIVAGSSEEKAEEGLTVADVRRIVQEAQAGVPSVEEFEERLRESTEQTLAERDAQRRYSEIAHTLIESAAGIPAAWKRDLKAHYSMLPTGAPETLLAEAEERDGKTLTPEQVIEERVTADIEHVRELLAEAVGKPRVRGEGGATRDPREDPGKTSAGEHHWRKAFVGMGLAESEEKAVELFGGKVEG